MRSRSVFRSASIKLYSKAAPCIASEKLRACASCSTRCGQNSPDCGCIHGNSTPSTARPSSTRKANKLPGAVVAQDTRRTAPRAVEQAMVLILRAGEEADAQAGEALPVDAAREAL